MPVKLLSVLLFAFVLVTTGCGSGTQSSVSPPTSSNNAMPYPNSVGIFTHPARSLAISDTEQVSVIDETMRLTIANTVSNAENLAEPPIITLYNSDGTILMSNLIMEKVDGNDFAWRYSKPIIAKPEETFRGLKTIVITTKSKEGTMLSKPSGLFYYGTNSNSVFVSP